MWGKYKVTRAKPFNRVQMLKHVICLQTNGSMWDQFPLICPITAGVGLGLPAKVTLHRGFLRVGAGHHHIVDPDLAKAYFSKHCWGEKCEIVMKMYKQRSTVDLYRRTPYFR